MVFNYCFRNGKTIVTVNDLVQKLANYIKSSIETVGGSSCRGTGFLLAPLSHVFSQEEQTWFVFHNTRKLKTTFCSIFLIKSVLSSTFCLVTLWQMRFK